MPKVGNKVIWIPSEVEGWGSNDEWSNPFAHVLGRPLTPNEVEDYTDWSEIVQHGTVFKVDEEFFYVRLEDTAYLFMGVYDTVCYPIDIDLGEYWARVRESVDFLEEGKDDA
jgi:hypothetical protein